MGTRQWARRGLNLLLSALKAFSRLPSETLMPPKLAFLRQWLA